MVDKEKEPLYTVICPKCGYRSPEDLEMYNFINKNGMCKRCIRNGKSS